MAGPRQGGFRLWPWRRPTTAGTTLSVPPSAQEVTEKLIELVHFERGIAALYYYLPDASLITLAHDLCQSRRSASILESGAEDDLGAKDPTLQAWRLVRALWQSATWQPDEILPTFGFRLIEALRSEPELWRIIADPQAQFFGLAVTTDETQRYWWALVTGQKGQEMDGGTATAAR
jgi:hypothetical protein